MSTLNFTHQERVVEPKPTACTTTVFIHLFQTNRILVFSPVLEDFSSIHTSPIILVTTAHAISMMLMTSGIQTVILSVCFSLNISRFDRTSDEKWFQSPSLGAQVVKSRVKLHSADENY